MQAHVDTEMNRRTNGQPNAEFREFLSLFRLGPPSDEQRLAGLTIQNLCDRSFYGTATEMPDQSRTMNWRPNYVGGHLFSRNCTLFLN